MIMTKQKDSSWSRITCIRELEKNYQALVLTRLHAHKFSNTKAGAQDIQYELFQ